MIREHRIVLKVQEDNSFQLSYESDGPDQEDRAEVYKQLDNLERDIVLSLIEHWRLFDLE